MNYNRSDNRLDNPAVCNTTSNGHGKAPAAPPAYRFVALMGDEPVAWSDALPAILCDLEAIHERGEEDIALWGRFRLLAVYTGEGRLVWFREVRT